MKTAENATMYNTVPVVSELNRVPGFDPLRFLRHTPDGQKLDLKYKKLWFRLKYPAGRIKLAALKITDQLAIIEARVYFDKNDAQPKSSFIAQRDIQNAPGGLYIESAQHAAIDQALSDAGFGIQFIPSQTADTPTEADATAKSEQAALQEVTPAPVETAVTEAAPKAAEPVVAEMKTEEVTVQSELAAAPAPEQVAAIPETVVQEEPAPAEEAPTGAIYTMDMPVEEICSLMSLDEAMNYIVTTGTCKGLTLSQVAERRPASLKFYLSGYTGDDNILRAGARLISAAMEEKKAS